MKNLTIFFILLNNVIYAQVSQEWEARYNGKGDYTDRPNAIVVDGNGNAYLAGYSYQPRNDRDYITIKLSSNGDTIWTRTYNGKGDARDDANALAIDASGNIYVSGRSNNGLNDDYVTIKYNSDGVVQWAASYDTLRDGEALAIAVDASGNVYVTGETDVGTHNDIITVKYSAAGAEQWAATFNGASNGNDQPVALSVDGSGNAYVTGRTANGLNDDIITLKYSTTGILTWQVIFNGVANNNDRPEAIAIDASGNVHIAARSNNGFNDDYLTLKYNSSGVKQWEEIYDAGIDNDRPASITIDGSSNVYVTGRSRNVNGNDDFVTFKYNSSGVGQWTAIYDAVFVHDRPDNIIVDGSGNVYVTGRSSNGVNYDFATVKYNSLGIQQWVKSYNGGDEENTVGIGLDALNNVYVTGTTDIDLTTSENRDILTIKYSSAGTQQWTSFYKGSGENTDVFNSMVYSLDGALYAAGYSYQPGKDKDYLLVKTDTSGNIVWSQTYDGAGNRVDIAEAIVTDGLYNVYITGQSNNGNNYDFVTLKYNSAGILQWTAIYNGTALKNDRAVDLSVDASGNVYVTGESANSLNDDIVTVKYNSSGIQQWVAVFNGSANKNDSPDDMTIDNSGNIYVTAQTNNGSNTDYVTLKYNSSGVQQWNAVFDGDNQDDSPDAIAVDVSGNVYVTGRSRKGPDDDYLTIKYDANGTQLWTALYDNVNNDRPNALAINDSGDVYVTGRSDNSSLTNNNDYLTVKYNSSGTKLWASRYNGSSNLDDIANSIFVALNGDVYIAGESNNGLNNDFIVVKYNSQGIEQWNHTYNGAANMDDRADKIVSFNPNSGVFVGGKSSGSITQNDISIIKLKVWITGEEELIVKNNYEIKAYPNPFNDNTFIKIPEKLMNVNDETIQLILYDVVGKEVWQYNVINNENIEIQKGNLKPGIYFLKLLGSNNNIIPICKLEIL